MVSVKLEDYERLTQVVPDSLLITNKKGEIIWANTQLELLLGYELTELIGAPIEKLVPANMRASHVRLRDHFNSEPSNRPMGYANGLHAQAKDGDLIPIYIELSSILWEGGRCSLAVLRSREKHDEQRRQLQESESRLKHSLAISHIGTWDWDILKNELIWTDEIYTLFDISPDKLEASYEGFMQFIHVDDRDAVNKAVEASITDDVPYRIEHRICRSNGEVRYVLELGKVYRDAERRAIRMLGTVQDITDEKSLHLQQRLSDTMFNHTREGIMIADGQFKITAINPALARITNFGGDDLINQHLSKLLPKELRLMYLRPVIKNLRKYKRWEGELNCPKRNSQPFPVLASITAVSEGDEGNNYYYVVTLTDVSKIKENEGQLQYMAHYDQLTKLPNRTLFLSSLKQALKKAQQESSKLAVLYIDLDGFKEINDTQGHNTGDNLLQEIAYRLRNLVPADTTVARLGGDEFAVLQPETSRRASQALAENIVKNLSMSKRFVNYTLDVSASVGVAHYPADGEDMMELLRKADQAMYQAKEKGKNRYQYYDSEKAEQLSYRIQMISDLNKAISEEAFEIHYQPKLDLTNNGFVNAEALLRWNHPQHGYISPMDFIPIAEDSGQILSIGRQVFKQVCQFISQWDARNEQRIKIAVNLSARQLQAENIDYEMLEIMHSTGVKGDSLEFEITESVIMHDVEASLKILEQLKSTGATIAIDDFGTGYSSLSYLKKLPVDTLKIDQSFVANLPGSNDDCAITTAIISLAHKLDLQVVAEGVETESQLNFLVSLGCEQLQGYFIGRPTPAENFPTLIRNMQAEQTMPIKTTDDNVSVAV